MSRQVKNDGAFNVLLQVDEGRRFWMKVETNDKWKGKPQTASWFVNPPNFIERLFKVTWQDKIAAMEKKLIAEVVKKINVEECPRLNAEIDTWIKGGK